MPAPVQNVFHSSPYRPAADAVAPAIRRAAAERMLRTPRRYEVRDPHYAERVRASFARQKMMSLIGAELALVAPGRCEIRLPFKPELTQQHGFFHGGAIGMIADSAGGYAAYTLMPADSSVLTVEYKMNLLAPGDGELLIADGQVLKAGKNLVISRAEVYAVKGGGEVHCATMQQTLMTMHARADA